MYFQQDNASCHKDQIISDWFLEHDNEFTLLKWPPQSPDLNPIEHLWDVVEREIHIMDVQTTNLQKLRDAIMTIWTKTSEECFQHLVESMNEELRQFWRKKGVQPGTSKVYLIKCPVRECVCVCVCTHTHTHTQGLIGHLDVLEKSKTAVHPAPVGLADSSSKKKCQIKSCVYLHKLRPPMYDWARQDKGRLPVISSCGADGKTCVILLLMRSTRVRIRLVAKKK